MEMTNEITWVRVIPVTGCVTRHDRRMMGDIMLNGHRQKTFERAFPTREKALAFKCEMQAKVMDKSYDFILLSDEEFAAGM